MQCTNGGMNFLLVLLALCFTAIWIYSRFIVKRCSMDSLTIYMRSPLITTPSYRANCTIDTCIDLLPCSVDDHRLTVYLEPLTRVFDERGIEVTERPSKEYLEMRRIIEASRFRVTDINDACLIIPGFDSLNLHRFANPYDDLHKAIAAGDRFVGRNLFLFTFVGVDIAAGRAIVARGQSHRDSFRRGFDVAIPLWLPPMTLTSESSELSSRSSSRLYLLAVVVRFAKESMKTALKEALNGEEDVLWLDECVELADMVCDPSGRSYLLDDALKKSDFSLINDQIPSHEVTLMASLRVNTIPLIVSDSPILPFSEVIQWQRISLTIYHNGLRSAKTILKSLSSERKNSMRNQIDFIYSHYFASLRKITLTTLEILEKRIIPNLITFSHEWNAPEDSMHSPPLFLPRLVPANGFTAVILSYKRVESLFSLIYLLARVPSLASIIVVWNNIHMNPPPLREWPHISRSIRVIRMKESRFSNRFIAFPEVTTEAVFSLDDDIGTLSVDEIEFAYQTWRENPERLVGFLPRSNMHNKSNGIHFYSSESSKNMNIIVTGAAFYHKYYGILYHKLLPILMRNCILAVESCEDIAMNFLISTLSGKCPLKVTLTKKFGCPDCSTNGISVWATRQIVQRSECFDKFPAWISEKSFIFSSFRYDSLPYHSSSFTPYDDSFRQVGTL
uniref:MICOS complex subunit MIC19 n=1 Tax=Parascaris univalens TaxID=6257 RepID=A0A915AN40_PARUN